MHATTKMPAELMHIARRGTLTFLWRRLDAHGLLPSGYTIWKLERLFETGRGYPFEADMLKRLGTKESAYATQEKSKQKGAKG